MDLKGSDQTEFLYHGEWSPDSITETIDDIRTALNPILCRCGSHLRVIRAIQHAAKMNSRV